MLFTAYNNTLIAVAAQMLRDMLGADADLVEVVTADTLTRRVADQAGQVPKNTIDDARACCCEAGD
ncbi:MAG: hypothetical protein U0075_03915 [Thermomicrobiales bacterium]